MTTRSLLLGISLAANAVLLAVGLMRPASKPALEAASEITAQDSVTATGNIPGSKASPSTESRPAFTWASLATPDLRAMFQRLLAEGFPRHIAVAIVDERLSAQTDALYLELWGDEMELPYWRFRDQHYSPETRARLFRNMEAKQSLAHELFTRQSLDDEHTHRAMARMFGIEDPAKLKALTEIFRDYASVMIGSLASNAGSNLRQTSRETSELVEHERKADIAALLTPAEYQEYQLRQSDLASQLRRTVGKYCATEEEYRALHAACAAVIPTATPDSQASLSLTDAQLLEQAKKILPPDRAAEVAQALAPGAGPLNRLAGRLGLSLATVAPVHVAQQGLKERATALRQNASLSSEQRAVELATIAGEATQRLTAVLGERGFAAYREYIGGWIDELTAPATAPASAAQP